MALSKDTLKTDLLDIFQNMKSDDEFCEKLGAELKSFGESGDIKTVGSTGTVSTGVYTEVSGSGSLSLDDSAFVTALKATCSSMKSMTSGGDMVLATALAAQIPLLFGEANAASVTSVGTTISPAGVPVPPTGGTLQGTLANASASATLVADLMVIFNSMSGMTSGGDEKFADEFATLIDTFLTGATIPVQGTGVLAGVVGSGTIS